MPATEMIVSIAVVSALALVAIQLFRLAEAAIRHRTVRRVVLCRRIARNAFAGGACGVQLPHIAVQLHAGQRTAASGSPKSIIKHLAR